MKTKSILFSTLCSLMISIGFSACDDIDDFEEPTIDPVVKPIYILNEGSWGANNANITSFIADYDTGTTDVYTKTNGKQMGDVANAMIKEDENIYVVLNGSKYAARLDLTTKEQARYSFPATEGEPRCIEVEDGYAYVTQYGGQVSKLNINDMTLAGTFKGEGNLEGIVEKNGKLYVAKSYTADGSGNFSYHNEVLVIDAKTMTQTGSISVVDNPTKMYEIDDQIYLISQGNYADVQPALQIIDVNTQTSKTITNASKITEGHNGIVYGVRSTYDANWQLANSFFMYNPKADELSETSFLQDAPASFKTDAIYLMEVDENTGLIYIGTTDYLTNGTLYQFDTRGKLIKHFDTGGINPSAMVFLD